MQSVMQEEECGNEEHGSKTKEEESKERKNGSSVKFPKLWSEEDEISLLSGYYEYQGIKDKSDVGGFHEFIKHRLIRCSVKQSQVSDKICRLKKKFVEHASKLEDTNENPHALDPHLQTLFELSRKIWGNNNRSVEETSLCSPPPDGVKKFELSNDFMRQEFDDFLFHEGVDVHLLDRKRVRTLKRKFGQVELSRSKFEYKQAKLARNMEKLKYDHYKRALEKFCS